LKRKRFMKNNVKAYELIEKGLSAKTVSKLNESQIETLYKKLVISEQVTEVPTKKTFKVGPKGGKVGNVMVSTDPNTKEVIVTTETEMTEDETDDVTDKNALGADALQNLTGQEAPHDANDMAPDGMDDDSDNNRKMMGMSEEKNKPNPWAICHSQVGPKKSRKWERCVKEVKKQLGEGKNPVSLFLENEIMKIVEKNLPPRITKGDLVKYLSEAGPATAPTKPAPGTKPGTKPGKPDPRPRPKHPGKNPNPGENPAPKAKKVSPEVAKDEVMDLIMKLLEK
jgi:hypothetical protein